MRADERILFISTISNFIQSLEVYAEDEEEIEKIDFFRNVLVQIAKDEIADDEHIKEIFWNDFENFISEINTQSLIYKRVLSKKKYPIVWRYWGFYQEFATEFGHSDKHVELLQGPTNKSGRHVYKGRPKRLTLPLTPIIEEGEIRYFTTVAKISEIDAVCSVPSIKHGMKIFESSRRILNPNIRINEWQRELDSSRLLRISSFLDDNKNTFANPCMIYCPDHSSVEWVNNSKGIPVGIHIDFQFLTKDLKNNGTYLTDHRGSNDLRPLNIIDGQHRIRGGVRSSRGSQIQIPIILFPPKLQNKGAAKYFAEINTLSQPLHKLHEIFMRHKFNLSSHIDTAKFGTYDGTRATFRDRANRLAYESAAYLNSHTPEDGAEEISVGALNSLIKILDENPEGNTIQDADMWIKFSYKWFMPDGPHPPIPLDDDDSQIYFEQIANYFDAFSIVFNKGKNMEFAEQSSKAHWLTFENLEKTDRNDMRPYIQYNTPFRALLSIYPKVVSLIKDSGDRKKVISRENFIKILKVFGNIDWLDGRIKTYYASTGEPPWKSLRQWMEDALDRESFEPYPENEIMSDSISSVRGKGILSPIAPGSISLVDPYHSWPEVGHPVEVIVTRPINASKTCSASIMNEKNDFVTGKVIGKKTGTAKPNHYTYKLNYWEGLEECKELTMICVWGNAVDREVSCSIKITR
jgi:hypothetical protein